MGKYQNIPRLSDHRNPIWMKGDRQRVRAIGKLDLLGKLERDDFLGQPRDKQAHNGYDTAHHGDHKRDHQPFKKPHRRRQGDRLVWLCWEVIVHV